MSLSFQAHPSALQKRVTKNMKTLLAAAFILCACAISNAQSRTNEAMIQQIRSLHAERSITATFNAAGNSSKIMAVTENFSDGEARAAGLQAMNFAMGFFYPGKELAAAPDEIHLAFWVLTKKPRFAETHGLKIVAGGQTVDLGEARYGAKPRENMEYLNFSVTRDDLSKLAQSGTQIQLGSERFTITSSQANTIKDLLALLKF